MHSSSVPLETVPGPHGSQAVPDPFSAWPAEHLLHTLSLATVPSAPHATQPPTSVRHLLHTISCFGQSTLFVSKKAFVLASSQSRHALLASLWFQKRQCAQCEQLCNPVVKCFATRETNTLSNTRLTIDVGISATYVFWIYLFHSKCDMCVKSWHL